MPTKDITVEGINGKTLKPEFVGHYSTGTKTVEVYTVPDKLKFGFIGMNKRFSSVVGPKGRGVKTTQKYGQIVLFDKLRKETVGETLVHEIDEEHTGRYGRMNYSNRRAKIKNACTKQGLPYRIAHRIALKFEDRPDVTPAQALRWYNEECKKRDRQVYAPPDWQK